MFAYTPQDKIITEFIQNEKFNLYKNEIYKNIKCYVK